MCFLWFHKWDKWKQYEVQTKRGYLGEDTKDIGWSAQIREKRECSECGKMQDRRVR